MYRISIVLPCYGRPERTKRSIECIVNQDINQWEAFIYGDGCPDFQSLIDSGYLEEQKIKAKLAGNKIHYGNSSHVGGFGHAIMNFAIQEASGKYFIFTANDDVILPNHFSHYLSEIEGTNYDLVFYDSFLAPTDYVRDTIPQLGMMAHCDIIVKTEIARNAFPHSNKYTHDWDFIYEILQKGNYKKAKSKDYTYKVMNLPSIGCVDNIN